MSCLNKQPKSYKIQEFKISDQQKELLHCILSYVYILWLVGLLSDIQNPKVKFHVNQGIILSVLSFSSLIAISLFSNVLYYIAPILASVTALLQLLWIIFSLFFIIVGIKNAILGKCEPLPFIGELFKIIK